MLSILGMPERRASMCDGLTRRGFLRIGGLAVGGLTLTDVLRAESRAGRGSSQKAVIMVFLPGGPPHQDMWDLKPSAPQEIRGPLQPIATSVPGIQICELFPRIAKQMDRFGYDTLWLAEHHFQHEGYEVLPNILMCALHIAHVTKNLKTGCG